MSGRAAENRTIRAADQARRREVIEAASDLFLRDGFVATTTDAIATRAGMSKKTLYRLFASKNALFEELVRAKLFELDIPPGTGSGRGAQLDRLTALLQAFAGILFSPERLALIRLILAERRQTDEMRDIFARLLGEHDQDVLTQWVNAEIVAGRLPEADPREGAQLVFDLALSGYLLDALLEMDEQKRRGASFDVALRERAALALHGLRLRGRRAGSRAG